MARFAQLGIPAVNYGPGISEIAHTAGEYVELAAIGACETACGLALLLTGPPAWPVPRSGAYLAGDWRGCDRAHGGGVLDAVGVHVLDRHRFPGVLVREELGQRLRELMASR